MPMSNTRRNTNRARCQFATCDKFAQTRGLCKAHGGGSRCRDLECNKLAQSRGLCIAHGGGRRCQFDGCKKLAQSKGYCISHGGGRRCIIPSCDKFSQVKGRCKSHSKLVAIKMYSPSQTIRTPPSLCGNSNISPVSTKLSIDFLVNPLSHNSSLSDKASSHQRMHMSAPRPITQLSFPLTSSGTRFQSRFDDRVLCNQRSLLSFLKPFDSVTSSLYASHYVAVSEHYQSPILPSPR